MSEQQRLLCFLSENLPVVAKNGFLLIGIGPTCQSLGRGTGSCCVIKVVSKLEVELSRVRVMQTILGD